MMHEKVFHFGEETLMLHKKKFHVKKQVSAAQESFIQKKQVSAAHKKVSCQKNRFLQHKKKFHVQKSYYFFPKRRAISYALKR